MKFEELVRGELADVQVSIDGPVKVGGPYVADFTWQTRHVVVEYSPKHGYGVSSSDDLGFGEKPDEVFSDPHDAAVRVVELLRSGGETRPLRLRNLREHRQITQAELAKLLGVGQAAVSKMENRDDVSLGSLRRFVEALGGHLELRACFPEGSFVLSGRQAQTPVGSAAQQEIAADGLLAAWPAVAGHLRRDGRS